MRISRMSVGILCGVMAAAGTIAAQNAGAPATPPAAQTAPPRPAPPTRDPNSPGFVSATELPDGAVPPADAIGNFIIGATHNPAPEMTVQDGVPQGTIFNLTMSSADSKIYPGVARDTGTFGTPDPADPAKLVVTTSHPAPYTRRVAVYVPKQYVPGTAAPFIVGADGPDPLLFTALDNLIAQKRVPVMIAISIGNGSGDAQGSQRGLEYDTMSGRYAEFVETEVLPLVEQQARVTLTKDPEGRATMGCSSGGSAALIMAWYHPEWYHRVLTYSGTFVNQQWPSNPQTPGGAWELHRSLIPNSPVKPLRLWMQVGDRDLFNPNAMRDNMHDWVVANENTAKVLAEKGYPYQFVFARNAGHCDRPTKLQTLPAALEWLWKGYQDSSSSAGRGQIASVTIGRVEGSVYVGDRLIAASSDHMVLDDKVAIRTARGRAAIGFQDGSLLTLDENSEVRVQAGVPASAGFIGQRERPRVDVLAGAATLIGRGVVPLVFCGRNAQPSADGVVRFDVRDHTGTAEICRVRVFEGSAAVTLLSLTAELRRGQTMTVDPSCGDMLPTHEFALEQIDEFDRWSRQ